MENLVRTQSEVGHVSDRSIPLPHLLVTATSSGAAQTFYTVRAGVLLKIKRLSAMNTSAGAVVLNVHSIPSGGSIGTGNTEIAISIPANTAADFSDYIGGLYAAGTVIAAYAATGGVIVLHGWAEEVL